MTRGTRRIRLKNAFKMSKYSLCPLQNFKSPSQTYTFCTFSHNSIRGKASVAQIFLQFYKGRKSDTNLHPPILNVYLSRLNSNVSNSVNVIF